MDKNKTVGVLLLINDPEKNIFPLLQVWPMAQPTKNKLQTSEPFPDLPGPNFIAEPFIWPRVKDDDMQGASILVRREGRNVLFITPTKDPPPS